jgi:excisionase family DNA binding protein
METNYAAARRKKRLGRLAYGIAEVADSLGVSVEFVRLELERKRLESFYAGRRRLIPAESLQAYMAGNR